MLKPYFSISQPSLPIIILTLLWQTNFGQKKEFTFNSPGNPCYFRYVCYLQSDRFDNIKHPFLFVLGKEGQTAEEAFAEDTLRFVPAFFNYEFVYVPNRGKKNSQKLNCIAGLASLVTYAFKYGYTNIFLAIKDTAITPKDIMDNGLNGVFNNVKIYPSSTAEKAMALADLKEDFQEKSYVSEDNHYGTYYMESSAENEEGLEETKSEKPKKIYFGKPTARDFTLTGVVRDKITGESLPSANITLKGTSQGVSTNADGFFTLLKVPSDTSVLVIQFVGYEKTEVYLTPYLPKKNLIIQLEPSNFNLQTATVIGHRKEVELVSKIEVSTIRMTPKKLEQLPNIGEKDVMRSFQLMPGVSGSNESSSGLYVRGGTPDQNLVLYDGFTVYHVDHLYGFFSAFNSNSIKDMQLYKGGFESKFGGRLSSVTEITGKEGNQHVFNIGGDLSLLSFNVYTEIPIGKKFSSIIAFRRSYRGALYNKIFDSFNKESASNQASSDLPAGPGGRQMQNTQATSYFYDLNGKFTYRPNNKDVFSLSIYNGIDKLDNSSALNRSSFGPSNLNFNQNSTDLTRYGNTGVSLKWSRKWSDRFYGNSIVSYSNYFSNRDRSREQMSINESSSDTSNIRTGILENNDLKDYSLKSDYEWHLSNYSQVEFGLFTTLFDIAYKYAQNDTSSTINRKDKALLAGSYIQDRIKLFHNRLQLLPGVRISYFNNTGGIYFAPRASFSLALNDELTFKGATGRYYQFANRVIREDILQGSSDFWLLADGSSVPISWANHYIIGLSYENNDYLFSTEGYYKTINNLTEYSLRFNASPMGTNYDENFFNGNGYAKGIEFLAQRKSGKLNGWVSYTLGTARNHFDVYADDYYPADQDVTHEFKIVAMYKYKRWDFAATWIYATGRPYTAPSGAYSVNLLDGTTQDFFTVTSKNALRLPNYHRLDISATYKLLKGPKDQLRRREIGSLSFSIFNLYNRKNVWYKKFTIEDGQIIETNVNYLGITPNFTLTLNLR